jgi:hypothetical protein
VSEKTAVYAEKHHDLGKKPLWNTPGLKLPAYVQNIAAALMRERGMDKSQAIATAVSRVKAWAAGGGNVSPEVKAAAQKAVAEWEGAKGKARSYGMSAGESDAALELAVELSFDEAAHPRAAAGSAAGGQFVAGDSGGGKGEDSKGKTRKELLRSLMSKKGADYKKLAAAEAAKKAKKGGKGGKDEKGKKAKPDAKNGAEPSKPGESKATKGKTAFKTLPAGAGAKKGRSALTPPRRGGTGSFRLAPNADHKKAATAVRRQLTQNRRDLNRIAREEGWSRTDDGWYGTQVRRDGVMMTVGIRQHQMGFVVSRGGETKTFASMGQARAWAMR